MKVNKDDVSLLIEKVLAIYRKMPGTAHTHLNARIIARAVIINADSSVFDRENISEISDEVAYIKNVTDQILAALRNEGASEAYLQELSKEIEEYKKDYKL